LNVADAVRARRMTRSFSSEPIEPEVINDLLDLATRAPSAGKSQGWHFVVLEGEQTRNFWDATLDVDKRQTFAWPRLLDAPVIVLPFADPGQYLERYSQNDKAATGLGESIDHWPAPYWTIDTSFAVMTLLLAATERGLGALFFGVFNGEVRVREMVHAPDGVQLLGAIALGRPLEADRVGRSAGRPRKFTDVVHRGTW
jgi:nitroreductase